MREHQVPLARRFALLHKVMTRTRVGMDSGRDGGRTLGGVLEP